MAVQPRQVLYTPVDVDDAQYTDVPHEQTEEEKEFNQFREELHDANDYGKITVYRQPMTRDGRPGQKKLTYLFDCGIDQYNFSQLASLIRDDYGSGMYRLQGRTADGQLKFNRSISIEAPRVITENSESGNIGQLIAHFSEAMERQAERIESMLRPGNAIDPLDQFTKMAAAMGGIMQAFSQPQRSMTEQLKEMMLLKKFMSDLNGESDSGDSGIYGLLSKTVENFGPLLTLAIAKGKQTGAIDASGIVKPVQRALPNPTPQTVSSPETPPMAATDPALEQHRQSLQFLLNQAKAGTDVFDVVAFVLNAVPDDQLETLERFLHQENCIELCESLIPEWAQYRDWLAGWRSACINELAIILDDDPDNADTPEPSDPPTSVPSLNDDPVNAHSQEPATEQ